MHRGRLAALDRTSDLLRRCGQKQLLLQLERPLAQPPAGLDEFAPVLEDDGRRLRLTLPAGQPAGAALERLAAARLTVTDLVTRQPDLEEVFLELIGLNGRRPAVGEE